MSRGYPTGTQYKEKRAGGILSLESCNPSAVHQEGIERCFDYAVMVSSSNAFVFINVDGYHKTLG